MVDDVRILAIAPYEGLASVLEREARTYSNVSMTIAVGNLEDGLAVAIEHLVEPFDLILSRGGTADLLRKELDIPVVDIKTSPFDVLQALQLSEDVQGKKAVVGFSGITDAARNTSDVLGLDLDIFTLVDEDDVHGTVAMLASKGCETILCDAISSTVFREHGFNTVLITSGSQSVRESIDEAVRISRHLRDAHTENAVLRETIRSSLEDIVIFREDGRIYFTTLDHGGSGKVTQALRDLIPEAVRGEAEVVRRSVEGRQYTIRTRVIWVDESMLVIFHLSHSRGHSGPRQAGITYLSKTEANQEYLGNPFSLTGDINGLRQVIIDVMGIGKPLLITGAYGTGRTVVASYAYVNSPRSSRPLVEIDCGMLTDRSREFLLNGRSSPLFDNGMTLHIKNMESCQDAFINSLFSTLVSTDACRRNEVIFSCNPRGERVSSYISYIKDKFQCMEIELHPLRENKERIPTIAKLYLSQLNADLPKEVLRIDRQAMDLLSEYPWPGNYVQFKRVLSQLCLISRDHTIRSSDVRELLALERPVYPGGDATDGTNVGIDLNRTLAQIERDVIDIVIKNNDGNQSAAARQLGISRTTLWRMLKDAE